MELDKEIQEKFNTLMAAITIAKDELQVYADEHKKRDFDCEAECQQITENIEEQFETIDLAIGICREWAEKVHEANHTYAGWSKEDVQDQAENLGYDIPDTVADAIMADISRKNIPSFEAIEDYILSHKHYGYDFTEYRNDMYCGGDDDD